MNVFLWNARARNGHVEATLHHPCPAQVPNALEAWWLTFVTTTSVGYGRIVPTTTMGEVIMAIMAVLGQFYLAMPLTIVGSVFYTAYRRRWQREQTILKLNSDAGKTLVLRAKIDISGPLMGTFVALKDLANELSKALARSGAAKDGAAAALADGDAAATRALLDDLLGLQPRVSKLVHSIEKKLRHAESTDLPDMALLGDFHDGDAS